MHFQKFGQPIFLLQTMRTDADFCILNPHADNTTKVSESGCRRWIHALWSSSASHWGPEAGMYVNRNYISSGRFDSQTTALINVAIILHLQLSKSDPHVSAKESSCPPKPPPSQWTEGWPVSMEDKWYMTPTDRARDTEQGMMGMDW